MTPSPTGLVSTALDRYARVHSTFPPPIEAGQAQDDKGAVLEKVYMKSVPTCVIWDGVTDDDADVDAEHDDEHEMRGGGGGGGDGDSGDDDEEDMWEGMQVAEDSEDETEAQPQRRRTGRK
jgi:ribosome biogenesis protein NSA1